MFDSLIGIIEDEPIYKEDIKLLRWMYFRCIFTLAKFSINNNYDMKSTYMKFVQLTFHIQSQYIKFQYVPDFENTNWVSYLTFYLKFILSTRRNNILIFWSILLKWSLWTFVKVLQMNEYQFWGTSRINLPMEIP